MKFFNLDKYKNKFLYINIILFTLLLYPLFKYNNYTYKYYSKNLNPIKYKIEYKISNYIQSKINYSYLEIFNKVVDGNYKSIRVPLKFDKNELIKIELNDDINGYLENIRLDPTNFLGELEIIQFQIVNKKNQIIFDLFKKDNFTIVEEVNLKTSQNKNSFILSVFDEEDPRINIKLNKPINLKAPEKFIFFLILNLFFFILCIFLFYKFFNQNVENFIYICTFIFFSIIVGYLCNVDIYNLRIDFKDIILDHHYHVKTAYGLLKGDFFFPGLNYNIDSDTRLYDGKNFTNFYFGLPIIYIPFFLLNKFLSLSDFGFVPQKVILIYTFSFLSTISIKKLNEILFHKFDLQVFLFNLLLVNTIFFYSIYPIISYRLLSYELNEIYLFISLFASLCFLKSYYINRKNLDYLISLFFLTIAIFIKPTSLIFGPFYFILILIHNKKIIKEIILLTIPLILFILFMLFIFESKNLDFQNFTAYSNTSIPGNFKDVPLLSFGNVYECFSFKEKFIHIVKYLFFFEKSRLEKNCGFFANENFNLKFYLQIVILFFLFVFFSKKKFIYNFFGFIFLLFVISFFSYFAYGYSSRYNGLFYLALIIFIIFSLSCNFLKVKKVFIILMIFILSSNFLVNDYFIKDNRKNIRNNNIRHYYNFNKYKNNFNDNYFSELSEKKCGENLILFNAPHDKVNWTNNCNVKDFTHLYFSLNKKSKVNKIIIQSEAEPLYLSFNSKIYKNPSKISDKYFFNVKDNKIYSGLYFVTIKFKNNGKLYNVKIN